MYKDCSRVRVFYKLQVCLNGLTHQQAAKGHVRALRQTVALPCYLFDQQTGLCCRTGPEPCDHEWEPGALFVEEHCLFFWQVAG